MAVIIPHVEHQRSPLPEFIARIQSLVFFVPKSCLFLLPKSCPLSLSVKHSPSYTKIRCRAKLYTHRSFQCQRTSFFPLARHRMKILNLRQDAKLTSEARQTNQQPLVHSPKTCS
ncbi:hypothetical protein AVEN_127988-1 [Araneus ventricosus]|uniref:Uncharacterized protein n=1 Tax=Araneus ventricosus TaxID=182803 RepID=A0A4Y1ZZP4_ARAVE|nr:hypothetical protein AVEN_127988-1 [Araneus ventricosus]